MRHHCDQGLDRKPSPTRVSPSMLWHEEEQRTRDRQAGPLPCLWCGELMKQERLGSTPTSHTIVTITPDSGHNGHICQIYFNILQQKEDTPTVIPVNVNVFLGCRIWKEGADVVLGWEGDRLDGTRRRRWMRRKPDGGKTARFPFVHFPFLKYVWCLWGRNQFVLSLLSACFEEQLFILHFSNKFHFLWTVRVLFGIFMSSSKECQEFFLQSRTTHCSLIGWS